MSIREAGASWLPDLCRSTRVAVMLGIAELVVIVIALAPGGGPGWSATRFLSASGLALWQALAVAVLLCLARRALSRLGSVAGSVLAVALAASVAAVGAVLLFVVDESLGYGLVPPGQDLLRFAGGNAAVTALIVALVLRYFFVFDGWRAQIHAVSRAEADALQARIRPHFLFNSMNTIAGLIPRNAALAERTVLDLSDLFRAAVGAGRDDSTLAEEVQLAEQYLAIETLRLGERLQVQWSRTDELPWELPMPRLLLQPLLENAVLHGISRLPQGGRIDIALEDTGKMLEVRISNDAPADETQPHPRHAGHAQHNIAHRLTHAFGPRARMEAGWHDGRYRCALYIPLADQARPQPP